MFSYAPSGGRNQQAIKGNLSVFTFHENVFPRVFNFTRITQKIPRKYIASQWWFWDRTINIATISAYGICFLFQNTQKCYFTFDILLFPFAHGHLPDSLPRCILHECSDHDEIIEIKLPHYNLLGKIRSSWTKQITNSTVRSFKDEHDELRQ